MGYGCLIPTNIFILQKVLIYGYIIIIPAAHFKMLKTLHFDHPYYTAYIAGIKHDNCYSDDGYIDDYHSDGDIPDTGGGVVSNEPLINTGLD